MVLSAPGLRDWGVCRACSSTIGNAYFIWVMHTDVLGLKMLAIVTNASHIPRTAAIFKAVFSLPGPLQQAGESGPHNIVWPLLLDPGYDQSLNHRSMRMTSYPHIDAPRIRLAF